MRSLRRQTRSLLRARYILSAVVFLVIAGAGWIVVTGLFARTELLAAQRSLETLRHSVTGAAGRNAAGAGTMDAEAAMSSAAGHAAQAHRLTTGPAWYLFAQAPVLGGPASTVRGAADVADRLTHDVLPPLVRIASEHAGDRRKRGLESLLSALQGQAPALERAARAAAESRADVGGLPRATWLPAVDHVRTRLAELLDRTVPVTADASMAARVLPQMMGEESPRRYFVVVQNTAEARGTGGMPGAFAVVTADRGRLDFETFGNDDRVSGANPTVDLGAEFAARYASAEPTRYWANSNMSPHFPYAARIWSATWRQRSGERVDGVVALDPTTLGRLLRATGPGRLPDGTPLTADNALDLTERTGYARYSDDARRKAFLLEVARTAATTLADSLGDPRRLPRLVKAAYGDAAAGRLKVWSARENEQRILSTRPLSGTFPETTDPFAGLVVNNAAGGKLDYYLERELSWLPGRCTPQGRLVTARIDLTNRAPASGLPAYVTQRGDRPRHPTRPGDNRLLVSYYASAGAQLTQATLDGQGITVGVGKERGHPVYTLDLELPARRTRTWTLQLLEPASDRAPVLWRQPLVTPLRVHVRPSPVCDGGERRSVAQ
ncbi:DUF4012 domain-containing protein [Streptomyces sp. Y2F8-2]|uniref:DUF4012 domain-containing protein n=1 Tax=Streptomyces sp. Y2F8-2 TaxID=2759675 RepID=UPI0019065557|nr:DUF4012 domain-containing protein [Streptomyces sp. Y2F8-2]